MRKYTSAQRSIYSYDIGEGYTLMNVLYKNEEGKTEAIDTYLGIDQDRFACVGHSEGLAKPGVVFRYSEYTKFIDAQMPLLMDMFLEKFTEKNE
ncbi:MAG: hypothetical protein LUE16_09720 [Lachnospiraceae bacterium]|nr:hypothetical protein [Lachnospiraceae bacterium]